MKKIIFRDKDGNILITTPHEKIKDNETENQYLERVRLIAEFGSLKEHGVQFLSYIDEEEIPESIEFRGALDFDPVTNKLFEETEKKKMIKWQYIRDIRNKLLEESDKDFIVALEKEDPKVNALKSYRQNLRDIPQNNSDPFLVEFPDHPTKGKLIKSDLRVEKK